MKRIATFIVIGTLILGMAFAYGRRFAGPGSAGAGRAGHRVVLAGTQHDDVAALLGITSDELMALRRSGATLMEILVEQGVDIPTFTAQLVQARDAAIDQAVAEELMTRTQGNRMQLHSEGMVQEMLQRETGPNAGVGQGATMGARAAGQQHSCAAGPSANPQGHGNGAGNGYR